MAYMLRSGLSKTVIYHAVIDNNESGILLPPMRRCTFNRLRNRYFLIFAQIDCSWSVSVFQWDGAIRYRFTKIEWFEYQDSPNHTNFPLHAISFDYLHKHRMLRELSGSAKT